MRAHERLLRYVAYPTGSDPESTEQPSSPRQWDLARDLAEEMRELGLEEVFVGPHCYVVGTIPSTIEGYEGPVLGLVSHMDVSSEAPFEDIRPQIIHYEGGDLVQDAEHRRVVRLADYPFLANYVGCDIITSDGSTLLGADDKAGIAEIMTMAERLLADPSIKHGPIRVCFTPDEEIGRGTENFDVEDFAADVAYTVDGAAFGEVQFETFNALSAKVTVNGFNIHPGTAKDKMVNAASIAAAFDAALPASERPEHTEGYQGFYHLIAMEGDVEHASLTYIIRDHDLTLAEGRTQAMRELASRLNAEHGAGTVEVEITESYRNMREVIDQHPRLIDIPVQLLAEMGVEADTGPIRGGTDGSELSFRGLPCPNLGVGGHNFHGRHEFAVIQDMDRSVELLLRLVQAIAQEPKGI